MISWSSWSGRMIFLFQELIWCCYLLDWSTPEILGENSHIIRVSLHTILTPWWLFDHHRPSQVVQLHICYTTYVYDHVCTLCSMYHCTVHYRYFLFPCWSTAHLLWIKQNETHCGICDKNYFLKSDFLKLLAVVSQQWSNKLSSHAKSMKKFT